MTPLRGLAVALLSVSIGVAQAAPSEPLLLPIAVSSPPSVSANSTADTDALPIALIQRFAEVYERVRQQYVEPLTDEQLFDNALRGLLTELDPYSDYLDQSSYNSILAITDGDIARAGVTLKAQNDQWRISSIDANSSASRAGLQVGDVVLRMDGKSLRHLTQQDIDQLLMGSVGSTLRLQVSSQGQRSREVRILRQTLDVRPVEASIRDDGIAVLKIHAFQVQTGTQIQAALDPWLQDGRLRGAVLDLRDNPGGLLASAVEVANQFLSQGLIVSTRGRGEPEQRYQVLSEPRYAQLPLLVLMNRYSASAAEVLAGALQDQGRALVAGQTSYGKGSVQKLWPIGQGRAIKLTVARYYTPNNRLIEGRGIVPDLKIALPTAPSEQDQVLEDALQLLRQRLPSPPPVAPASPVVPNTPPVDPQKN